MNDSIVTGVFLGSSDDVSEWMESEILNVRGFEEGRVGSGA